jgi:lipopolysaccharide/colanic/teichoic acid biosynthesis glycosyltransferase
MAKRLFDIAVSALGLVVLAIPLALIAVAVKCDSAGPVFFRQTRIGRGGVPFEILKFRSMRSRTAEEMESEISITVGEDPRVTRLGRYLRRWKLDELPQLINVLVGDMSVVGPRPEVPEYAHVYPEQERVWSVRPGITDPTSIEFRDEASLLGGVEDPDAYYRDVILRQKTDAYLRYIDRATLRYDVAVIFETLRKLAGGAQRD